MQPGQVIAVLLVLAAVLSYVIERFLGISPVCGESGNKLALLSFNLSMLMTWGGLRGAISIALLRSLPTSPQRDLSFDMTYAVVVFSLVVRNNYFALARWGARCPSRPLVARAFGLLESMQGAGATVASAGARDEYYVD